LDNFVKLTYLNGRDSISPRGGYEAKIELNVDNGAFPMKSSSVTP